MKILITGGTGHLGRAIIPRLLERGHQLRVMARTPGKAPNVEWCEGDLATGRGIAGAVTGADIVIHAATCSPIAQRGAFRLGDLFSSPTNVDVGGTRALLEAAEQARVHHFVHVSIVGLEQTKRLPYSRVKLAAEDAVRQSSVPWSIVRATGFYWLLERLCANLVKKPVLILPADVRMQPVDSDDFASWVADCALADLRGRRPDFAGPQVLSFREIIEQYRGARGLSGRVWNLPLPRAARLAMERGQTAPDAHRGTRTWASWLAAR